MGEFDGAEAIAALGFDRRSQQKAVFGDVNAHIRQFLGSGFLKNGSSKFRQTAVRGYIMLGPYGLRLWPVGRASYLY